jgi:hypothetical protein
MKATLCRRFRAEGKRVPLTILFLILALSSSEVCFAERDEERAIRFVQEYGSDRGDKETISSVIDLYWITYKPNSKFGVDIRGWFSFQLREREFVVVYAYIEKELYEWKWEVSIEEGKIKPLDSMASAFIRMAEIF